MRIALAFALLLLTSVAHADDGSFDAHAVKIGHSALEAYGEGMWATAFERFAEAEALAHSPVFVLYMARCQRNLGKLLEARELLRAVSRETLAPATPLPWQQAVASAHAELGSVQQSIPSLLIRSTTPTVAVVAGRKLELSSDGEELELDPGEYVIEYRDRRGAPVQRTVQLSEGRRRVPVMLNDDAAGGPRPKLENPYPSAPSRSAPTEPPLEGWRRVAGWSALGVGAAGLGLGVVSGLVAKNKGDQLRCSGSHCAREDLPEFESASDWAAVSTVSFIFSGSALLSGAALLLLPAGPAPLSRAAVSFQGTF